MHQPPSRERTLLTALEVQEMLHIDRSTVYRMADDGRLPSIRVGRTRRFPADAIAALAAGAPASPGTGPAATSTAAGAAGPAGPEARMHAIAQATIDVASELLGVMMVVTDMSGTPVTEVANPCPWFARNSAVEGVLADCIAEWHELAADPDFTPRFAQGRIGFQCARTFIRSGNNLIGMVLAGGVSPPGPTTPDPGLYHLDPAGRDAVLSALPRIAAAISNQLPQSAGAVPQGEN